MAVERVRQRLERSTHALEQHRIPYAVIGGNAVAAWVASVDEGGVRNTKDVDILVNRTDLRRIGTALTQAGFSCAEIDGRIMFLDPDDPIPKKAIQLVFAGEPYKPGVFQKSPSLDASVQSVQGYRVIDSHSLIAMKLSANRTLDRVHIEDMLGVNLITPELSAALPDDLRERLEQIRATCE